MAKIPTNQKFNPNHLIVAIAIYLCQCRRNVGIIGITNAVQAFTSQYSATTNYCSSPNLPFSKERCVQRRSSLLQFHSLDVKKRIHRHDTSHYLITDKKLYLHPKDSTRTDFEFQKFHSANHRDVKPSSQNDHESVKRQEEEEGEDSLRIQKIILERLHGKTFQDKSPHSRRMLLSSILFSTGIAMRPDWSNADTITWSPSPINKRSGVSLYQAEEVYNVRFITYLTRFLLSFDEECQILWYKRAGDIPKLASKEEVENTRLKQFAMFAASVEVGLQEFQNPKGKGGGGGGDSSGEDEEGPKRLMKSLLERYGKDFEEIRAIREEKGLPPLKANEEERVKREIREAKRQIALLFGLLDKYQPTDMITTLLADIDNGQVRSVDIINPGSGYAPGYGPPRVVFPSPEKGEEYAARGRAVLVPNGRILRIDLDPKKRGMGYSYTKPPVVTISPPSIATAVTSGDSSSAVTATTATAKAVIFRDSLNKGKVERIELTNPGSGYTDTEPIQVTIAPPAMERDGDDVLEPCVAKAVLEYQVEKIEVTYPGEGYAAEMPLQVMVDPPPLTARINLNDPVARQASKIGNVVTSKDIFPSLPFKSKMKQSTDKDGLDFLDQGVNYELVVARAYPVAENDSYKSYRKANDNNAQVFEASLLKQKVSAAGDETSKKSLPFWTGGKSSSSQLLSLLPAGIGLVYNRETKRYELAVADSIVDDGWNGSVSPGRPIDPDFGPRGRSPIEREKELDASTLFRFYLSGAICCSAVHLVLTPIDVIKTNMQTKPEKYPNPLEALRIILNENGVSGFFTGWVPTFVGFFITGGISYTAIEFFRRYYTELAGSMAESYEIPIILAASFTSAVIGVFTLTPSEAIRIRSVAQPDYASNVIGVTKRMIEEEGFGSLFNAVPAFMLKEIPFVVGKFTVFDLSTEYLYDKFPAAREELQLSLIVSLVGGTLGGICAALVSNPADATISEMKKAKTDDGPLVTFQKLVAKGGTKALFRGLGVRMFFYTVLCSLQFLVYDAVRISLGIGNDDLKLYLDVLGGALNGSGGPI
mmetsp:Transcript_11485/g.21479  ORF Transcript_11485/g.21479 Transcript_11485/m.21479 type:complete len:1046 (-) Transcript_11485:667-3804(-)